MLLTMGVSLYTSRVVLSSLGIEDYGIYTVVGGVVSLFSFLNAAMVSGTQRFLAIDIGQRNWEGLRKTFNATLLIHIAIAIILLLIGETLGGWFVNNKLNISINRQSAAGLAFQFSLLAACFSVIQGPYNALLIAREKMGVFAAFGVLEVILKLVVAYAISISEHDKLIVYSILIFIVTFLMGLMYQLYCFRYFKESRFKIYHDFSLLRDILAFSGWNLFGNIAAVAKAQGINILLNVLYGTALNAAYGIMLQVQNAVSLFVTNFQTAINPQIFKNYANRDFERMQLLMFQGARYSFFLLVIIVFPLIYNVDYILMLWLNEPPKLAGVFITLTLVNLLIETISRPLITGALATGQIKWYQIVVGSLLFLNLPLSYILFLVTNNPATFLYVAIFLSFITLIFRVLFLTKLIHLNVGIFLNEVGVPIIKVSFLCLIFYFVLQAAIGPSNSFFEMVTISTVILIFLTLIIYSVGVKKSERNLIKSILLTKIYKR